MNKIVLKRFVWILVILVVSMVLILSPLFFIDFGTGFELNVDYEVSKDDPVEIDDYYINEEYSGQDIKILYQANYGNKSSLIDINNGFSTIWTNEDSKYLMPINTDHNYFTSFADDNTTAQIYNYEMNKTSYYNLAKIDNNITPRNFKMNHELFYLNKNNSIVGLADEQGSIFKFSLENKEIQFVDVSDILIPLNNCFIPGDKLHFNSIDLYGEGNALLSSRNLGILFSIKMFDKNFDNFLESDKLELNWLVSGNGVTPFFLGEDDVSPLVSEPSDENSFVENIEYEPQLFSGYENKILSFQKGSDTFKLNTLNDSIHYENEVDNDDKFWGQHDARILNGLIEEYTDEFEETLSFEYDSNNIYISFFDNHLPGKVTYPEISNGGAWEVYGYHNSLENGYTNQWDPYEDHNSYLKIIEVNPNDFASNGLNSYSWRLVYNHSFENYWSENLVSEYQSSSELYVIDNSLYLLFNSSYDSEVVMYNMSDENSIVFDFKSNNNFPYRSYFISDDLNYSYGFNAQNYV